MSIYSAQKAAHHLDKIRDLRDGKLIFPTQVQIDITNHCPHKCPYCFYRCAKNDKLNALFNENDILSTQRVLTLLQELKDNGVPAVQFTGGGEPFSHPGITDILKKTIELGLEMAIVTNGALVTEEHLPLIAQATWIRFSMDGATPQMYSISQGAPESDYHHVIDIIKKLVAMKTKTVVGTSFVINPINYREIEAFADLVKSLGVHNVRYSVAYTPRGIDLYSDIWNDIKARSYKTRRIQTPDFRVFDLADDHLCNLDMRDKGYSFCGYQHFTSVIGADGGVYPCCTLKYNASIIFGNINTQSFEEVWLGERRQKWLKMDHLKFVCDKHPCWFDAKNRLLSYLVSPNPPHVNYI